MKNASIQLLQWIIKYKKRLIYGGLAIFIGQICFFNLGGIGIQNEVFAQTTTNSKKESTEQRASFDKLVSEKASFIDFFRKTAYIVVYPLMFLAGKLVDNSLVYGEIFNFDTVLWQMWNMIRNIANFGLGFIFIFYVFKYLITGDKKKDPKWIIRQSLIAGIGIQASWFLMAVLIDISTILIYGVGGLPLSILGGNGGDAKLSEENDPYMMKTIVSVNANDVDVKFYLTNIPSTGNVEQIYISECETFQTKDSGGNAAADEYILAPKMIYYQNEKGIIYSTMPNVCSYYGNVYWFEHLHEKIIFMNACGSNIEECKGAQSDYDSSKKEAISILQKDGNAKAALGKTIFRPGQTGDNVGWDVDNKIYGEKTLKTKKLSQLIEDDKGDTKTFVGVFTSLYASLLEAGRGMIPTSDNTYINFLSGLISLGHALAIAIPLAAGVLVLVMRIGIIWMAIVLSPIIILLSAYGFLDEKSNNKVMSYFQIKNLIGIVFFPAVLCFAVSMSTVLVRLIDDMNYKVCGADNKCISESDGKLKVLGLIEMNLGGFTVDLMRLITGIAGVAVSWFLMWMAVKSSKLGESKLISNLEGLTKSAIGSIPIIPIPGKNGQGIEFIGANSFFGLNGQQGILSASINNLKNQYDTADNETLNQLLNPQNAQEDAAKKKKEEKEKTIYQNYSDWLDGLNKVPSNRATQTVGYGDNAVTFSSLSDSNKKKVIDKINNMEERKRAAFGNIPGYKYNESTKKYEQETSSSSSQTTSSSQSTK